MKKLLFTVALACMTVVAQAQVVRRSWCGELDAAGQKLPLVLNLVDGKCTLDSPSQGAKGIPADVELLTKDSIKINIKSLGVTYSARSVHGDLDGTFIQRGFKFPLYLKPCEPEVPKRPQNPMPPFPYTTEEVKFTNAKAGATLAGTLTVPKGGAKRVMIMVTGSGPENRDEEVAYHKPFAVIADRLARAGIATLRYDDRGVGQSVGGETKHTTSEDVAEDAIAGIEWLRAQKRFKKVGLLGHSEGGLIAFMLAAQKKVDFIVSLAGPAVRGDSIMLYQARTSGNPFTKNITVENLRNMMKTNTWVSYFMDYDPTDNITNTKCPVLALNGSKDCQVPAAMNIPVLHRLLAKNKKAVVKEYEGLNHMFQQCTTGRPDEYYTLEETMSEEVLSDIVTWLKKL